MNRTNPDVDAYFSKAKKWQQELEALRMLILDCHLSEEMRPGVQFFAGFTLSLAFRYSVIFIARLKKSQTTPPLFGFSSYLCLSSRDSGCVRAMWCDGSFRKDRLNEVL